MIDNDKIYQCPICIKGKYKECSLIQHLIDKHPEYHVSQKIQNEYSYPMSCPLCAQKITKPISLITHYHQYHSKEFESLKLSLGFDLDNNDSKFNSSDPLEIVPNLKSTPVFILQNDEKIFQKLFNLTYKSPIMHSLLKSSNLLVICCNKGIILIDLNTNKLGEFLNQNIKDLQPIIEYNTPNDSYLLASKYGISLPTNINSDPFICQTYTRFIRTYAPPISSNEDMYININKSILKTDLKQTLMNIAIAYQYLISLNFFSTTFSTKKEQNHELFKCPCCDITDQNITILYRHLFRMHQFPAMIMNQYKMPEQKKGIFICADCHEQNLNSFDDLEIHVYENHRNDLLTKTLNYIESHPEISKSNPELENFIRSELKKIT